MKIMNAWSEQVMREFPTLQLYSRPLSSMADYKGTVSIETYQKCELLTYSLDTLRLFYLILRNTAIMQQAAAQEQEE